jgi:hypothetical protein
MRPTKQIVMCLLVLLTLCEGKVHPRVPYGGSSDVYCNPVVVNQMLAAWMADGDGTLKEGTWEYGFRVDYAFGHIQVGELVIGDDVRHITIMTNENTIAIVHVHPVNGVSTPSDLDLSGKFPDYVISKQGLWLTNPRTHTYQFVRPFGAMFLGCPVSAAPKPAPKRQSPPQSKAVPAPSHPSHPRPH